ncbi:G2/mitotic-specific cyclin S13-7 [Cryptomeria japonica]|uniref:G2/mitotic-specific cyclin S13-7 n=1 Tax=Cryptomeria japonica TaxID=3369 RepID=UPI0027D9D8CB|nr:G2/mitotic-specific cyclin S13-7 [Cryptomeria japonica]
MANRPNPDKEIDDQKVSQAEARNQKASQATNRAVLADIGNTVVDNNTRLNIANKGVNGRTVQGRRPITRSYGAQLLANARSAATNRITAADKNTKAEVMNKVGKIKKGSDLPGTRVATKENTKDKVLAAKQPTRVQATSKHNVRAAVARKRRPPTLTATLVARSKAFCTTMDGERTETESLLPNIDEGDLGNQFAVVEYVEDIYNFYRKIESKSCVSNYMPSQTDINGRMRGVTIDWLIEVHRKFELMPETLYLTANVFDRYLSIEFVSKRNLQLVGITAMLVASKYEEVLPPEMDDFFYIAEEQYTKQEILTMEKTMLNKLKFHLTVPTPYVFAIRFLKAAGSDEEMENVVFFFLELTLLRYVMIKFRPSMLAAAAVFTAQCTLKKEPVWNETLKRYTGYAVADLKECARLIVIFHQSSARSEFETVYKKYSSPQFGSVALKSPAQLPA